MVEERLERLEKMIQRANDILDIQNVMSKHEYYHAVGMHKEELNNIWARKTPGIRFGRPGEKQDEGWDEIWKHYGEGVELQAKKGLEEIRKIYPQIEDDPKNYHIGTTVMHTLTTPVIEVAEDGKTGKGVWISPGHITGVKDGKLQASWFWERYACDFVKEDGKWKIWHLYVVADFSTPYEKSWVESYMEHPMAKPGTYPGYTPFTVPKFYPKPPEPYETYRDTFSTVPV